VQEIERSGGHFPRFVRREFEDYLKCGRLERLCRYIMRPFVATKRLAVDGRGRVVYRYS
jgi:hypothetical protein